MGRAGRSAHTSSQPADPNGAPACLPSERFAERAVAPSRTCGQEETEEPVAILMDGKVLVDPSNTDLVLRLRADHGARRRAARLRRRGRGRRAGGARGRGVRVVRGPSRRSSSSASRSAVKPVELTDPQLPWVLARTERRRPRAARLPAGWVFGAQLPADERGREPPNARTGATSLTISDGSEVDARAVVLATGADLSTARHPELEALNGAGVFYGASVSEAQALEGEHVFVVGGGNSAGQAASPVSLRAKVTMLVRGPRCRRACPVPAASRSTAPRRSRSATSARSSAAAGEGRLEDRSHPRHGHGRDRDGARRRHCSS